MLSTAVEDEIIDRNPCSIKGVYSTTPKRPTRAVTATELRRISESMPPGYEAAILIAGWCGLRWGEVVALRRCDVNLQDGVLVAYQAFSVQRGPREPGAPRAGRSHSKATFMRGNVKTTGSLRDVELPPHIVPALTHHLNSHVEQSPDALLFPSVRSKKSPSDKPKKYPVSGSTFHKWFKTALKEAGVADMRFHELRHTAATLAMQTGQASGFDVMARLGHTSPKTAALYQHSSGTRQRGIADALSESARREDPGLKQ